MKQEHGQCNSRGDYADRSEGARIGKLPTYFRYRECRRDSGYCDRPDRGQHHIPQRGLPASLCESAQLAGREIVEEPPSCFIDLARIRRRHCAPGQGVNGILAPIMTIDPLEYRAMNLLGYREAQSD